MTAKAIQPQLEDEVYKRALCGQSYRSISMWIGERCHVNASHEAVRSCVRRVGNQRREVEADLFAPEGGGESPVRRLARLDRSLSMLARRAWLRTDLQLALRVQAIQVRLAACQLRHERFLAASGAAGAGPAEPAAVDPAELPAEERPDHFPERPFRYHEAKGASDEQWKETLDQCAERFLATPEGQEALHTELTAEDYVGGVIPPDEEANEDEEEDPDSTLTAP